MYTYLTYTQAKLQLIICSNFTIENHPDAVIPAKPLNLLHYTYGMFAVASMILRNDNG